MADIPSVTPATSTTPVSSNTPQLANVPVQQTPEAVTTPAQLTGTVISSNPQTQQLSIQTAQGQVTVQSSAALPPDTPVTIELYTVNAQTRATVTIVRQSVTQTQAAMTQTLENAVQPLPLQEGSTVTALQLPSQTTQPVSIEQLASSIENLKMSGLKNFQLPLPPQLLQELLNTSDIKTLLKQQPPQLLRNMADFFSAQQQAPAEKSPGLLRQLLSAYLPQKFAPGQAADPAMPGDPENDLMQVLRAPWQGKPAAQDTPPTPAKPSVFSSLTSPLDMLIASSSETSHETSGFSAILRQLMPQNSQGSAPAPQNMFRLHILKILPPQTTPEQIKDIMAKMPAAAQAAEVEASTSGRQPLLKTTDAHYVVSTPADVPEGSTVIFEATPMAPEDVLQPGLFTTSGSDPAPKNSWPALQEALKALPSGSAAAQALKNTLPAPTAQLAPTALLFLAAMRSGAVSNWLGPNTLQALQQAGKKELADTLSDDFDKLATQSKEILPGNWRAISIPLHHDGQISQMQFYVRQQSDQEQNEGQQGGGKPATRFILDLSLSRMGAVQLDGFIHKKNFDIILRTDDKLPFDMRQELMKRFAQGLDQVQMQGGISFQTRQQGWMVPEAGNTMAEA